MSRLRCCPECGTVIHDGAAKLVKGPLVLDRGLRRVTWRERDIHLTKTEFEILELLAQREGRLVQSWAFFIGIIEEDVDDKILDVYVCKIRSRFRSVDPEFDALVTQWGEGYIWKKIDVEPTVEVDRADALRARLARARP